MILEQFWFWTYLNSLSGVYLFKKRGRHLLRVAQQLEQFPTPTKSMIELADILRRVSAAIYENELPDEDDDGIGGDDSEEEIEDNYEDEDNEEISVVYHYIPPSPDM